MALGPIMEIVRPYLRGKVKRSGGSNVITLCPFHDDHNPSFWLNIENGLWLCFSCGLRGSLYTFLKLCGMSYSSIDDVMEPVRLRLELFRRKQKYKKETKFYGDPFKGDVLLPEALLGVYDYCPNNLVDNGFEPSLLKSFDIGYDRRLGRITFPIRDLYGNLVGVSGRGDGTWDGPRYKVYRGAYTNEKGERVTGDFGENFDDEYGNYELDSHRFLWNSHNVYPSVELDKRGWEPIVITEGYKACMWVVQHGFPTAVALSGSSISEDQRNLLIRMAGNPLILFMDNDEPGIRATLREGKLLSKSVNDLWVATYPEGYEDKSPDDLDGRQIKRAIYGSEEWRKWHRMQISKMR